MKRFLTLIAAVIMVMTAMAQTAGIVLSYNKGNELKFYKYNELDKAINDAEVNDTIYFGPGEIDLSSLPRYEFAQNYASYRQINKPLTFIGAGAHWEGGTIFSGDFSLFLNIDSTLEESKKKFSFEGIYMTDGSHHLRPSSDLTELKLINTCCSFNETNDHTSQPVIDRLIIDRSYCSNLLFDKFMINHIIVNNSKIIMLRGGCSSSKGVASFNHCYINNVMPGFVGFVEHSIIQETNAGREASIKNCCYKYNNRGSSLESSTQTIANDVAALDNNPSSLGKCDDGTVYGSLGGDNPYTLYPQYPTADLSKDPSTGKARSYVDYDAINKKLTITVKTLGK